MRKAGLALLFLIAAIASLNAAVTYIVTATPPSTIVYSDTQLSSSTTPGSISTTRSNASTNTPYYYLVSGAQLGQFTVGNRRLYLNGSISGSWLNVYLQPTAGSTEIGSTNTSGTTVISGTMNKNLASTVQFIAVTDPAATGANIPDGTYQNTFTFSLYVNSTTPPGGTSAATSVSVTVSATVSLSVITVTVSPATCDFGLMAAGNSYSASTLLSVQSNRVYSIVASSTHSGSLFLSATDTIAYTFSFAGTSYPLSSGSVQLVTNAPAGSAGYAVNFGIPTLGFIQPGTYSDSVTFVVSSP